MTEVDEDTVSRARRGDPAARGTLVRTWHPALFAGALRLLGYRRHDAEEAVQETWTLIFQGFPQLRAASSWKSWSYSILRNVCLRQIERRPRPLPHPDREAPESTETSALEGPEKARLATAVQAMPAAYREAVTFRYFQKLSYGEIAEALGISVGTAKSNVHKGLAWLERRLRGVVPSHE